MSKPRWTEAWAEAFEEGFREEIEAEEAAKGRKAIAVRQNEDGSTEIIRAASGAEAERMIAEAEAKGLSVEKDATRVEALMAEQNGATDVPPEVYRLMSAVIDFAQELSAEWRSRHDDNLLEERPQLATEIEFTSDDIARD